MLLTHKQGLYAMFHFLDEIYFVKGEDDALGALLSNINPYLFIGSDTADKQVWHDWEKSIKEVIDKENITPDDAFEAMINFLKMYYERFDFNLDWLIKELQSSSEYKTNWLNCINRVSEL